MMVDTKKSYYWNVIDRHTHRILGKQYASTRQEAIESWLGENNQEVSPFNISLLDADLVPGAI